MAQACCLEYSTQVQFERDKLVAMLTEEWRKRTELELKLSALAKLQAKGYNVPDYPANPKNAEEEKISFLNTPSPRTGLTADPRTFA